MPAFKDRLADAAYRLGWSVVCRLPERWTAAVFRWVADVAWRREGPRVRTLEDNLRRVLGPDADGRELRAVSRESMRSYARYWLEVFRLPVIPVERLVSGMQEEGEIDTTLGYIKAGRGVIFALPHMGNWDQAGAWIIARGAGSFTTVMERLKPGIIMCREKQDSTSAILLEKIVADEEKHVDYLETQLELMEKLGEELYSAQCVARPPS